MRLTRRTALVAMLAVVTLTCAPKAPSEMPAVIRGGMRFALAHPDARSVALAGSFNDWSTTSHRMVRGSSGIWTIVVALPPGEHQFMFVVNDVEWITPPAAEDFADDGFGKRNGIVVVRPDES
jgi:1,4-alpha-glucan branching enzyme